MATNDDAAPTAPEDGFRESMKALRAAQDLNQTDLARKIRDAGLAFHQSTIAKIESGTRPVRLDEAYAIAQALGSSADDMTRGPARARNGWTMRSAHKDVMESYETAKGAARELFENLLDLEQEVKTARRTGKFSEMELVWDGASALQYDPISAVQDAIAELAAGLASAEVLERYKVKEQTVEYLRELYRDALESHHRFVRPEEASDGLGHEAP